MADTPRSVTQALSAAFTGARRLRRAFRLPKRIFRYAAPSAGQIACAPAACTLRQMKHRSINTLCAESRRHSMLGQIFDDKADIPTRPNGSAACLRLRHALLRLEGGADGRQSLHHYAASFRVVCAAAVRRRSGDSARACKKAATWAAF